MGRSIATRTGDDGTTSLLYGQRVSKDHPQIEAVGAFDELNVALGQAKLLAPAGARGEAIANLLTSVQRNLIALMGEIACAAVDDARYHASDFDKLSAGDVQRLDDAVRELETRGLTFTGWATPGGTPFAATLEVARTTARRAERRLIALPGLGRPVRLELRQFVNRLSDVLWLLAREAEQASRPPAPPTG
jgi:cob(I)alamin adenosyltransferase